MGTQLLYISTHKPQPTTHCQLLLVSDQTAISSQGMMRIQLKIDSSNLVAALKSTTLIIHHGMLILEVRQLIDLEFMFCYVSFAPWCCNMCVHELARSCLKFNNDKHPSWDSD